MRMIMQPFYLKIVDCSKYCPIARFLYSICCDADVWKNYVDTEFGNH